MDQYSNSKVNEQIGPQIGVVDSNLSSCNPRQVMSFRRACTIRCATSFTESILQSGCMDQGGDVCEK